MTKQSKERSQSSSVETHLTTSSAKSHQNGQKIHQEKCKSSTKEMEIRELTTAAMARAEVSSNSYKTEAYLV